MTAATPAGHAHVPRRTELEVGGVAHCQLPGDGHRRRRRRRRLLGTGPTLLHDVDLRRLLAVTRRALAAAAVVGAMLPTSIRRQ